MTATPDNSASTTSSSTTSTSTYSATTHSTPERTQQQLDPAAALGGRIPAIALCSIATGWTIVALTQFQAHNDGLALKLLTLLLLLGAAAVIVIATTPALAPFTMREHLTVHLLTLSAFLIDLVTSWGTPRVPQDVWVSACLGLFLIAISPYRPARELVIFGTASASTIGVFTLLGAQAASPGGIRPLALVLFALLPVLACCYGAARQSSGIVRDYVRWRRELDRTIASQSHTVTTEIYRAVQLEKVGHIARDVVPLLNDILYEENISELHRTQARAIATRIRGELVEDVDRTWLQTSIAPLVTPGGRRLQLDDPDGLAAQMARPQRTALHALLFSLMDAPATRDASITIYLQGDVCAVTVAAGTTSRVRTLSRTRASRARYTPFIAVMRSTFDNLSAEFTERELIVKFEYAQR